MWRWIVYLWRRNLVSKTAQPRCERIRREFHCARVQFESGANWAFVAPKVWVGPGAATPSRKHTVVDSGELVQGQWTGRQKPARGPVQIVQERPVAKSDVPDEWYSPTQPFPTK